MDGCVVILLDHRVIASQLASRQCAAAAREVCVLSAGVRRTQPSHQGRRAAMPMAPISSRLIASRTSIHALRVGMFTGVTAVAALMST